MNQILESYPEQSNTPKKHFINKLGRPNEVLPSSDTDTVACAMETTECPDGSLVGRTGPNCEFSACPVEK